MPNFKHVVELDYKPSFRSEKVAGLFDIPVQDKLHKEWNINIPLEDKEWKIGLITGTSGSGKTTIARRLFDNKMHTSFEWKSTCLLDDFPQHIDMKTITETLSKVGFSSPPSWLLPYSALSNGQKFRVELARCLLEYDDLFVFDEFTSVVDRQVAQISAFAFQKILRKNEKKFVAVTCHYDVEEWLQPDWVFDISSNSFKWGSLQRPEIKLEITRIHYSAWELFKNYHYLTGDINNCAICYGGFINNNLVVFTSFIHHVGTIKAKRGHRTVCLPDYQGLNLGYIITNTIASMFKSLNFRVFTRLSHPSLINKRLKDKKNWIMLKQGKTSSSSTLIQNIKYKSASNRLTCGFEYIGDLMNKFEAEILLNKKGIKLG